MSMRISLFAEADTNSRRDFRLQLVGSYKSDVVVKLYFGGMLDVQG